MNLLRQVRALTALALTLVGTLSLTAQSTDTVTLSRGWRVSEAGTNRSWRATVPGVVQQDLIRERVLPNPYYRLAEDSIQWVGERDWVYRTTFRLSARDLARPTIQLLLEGLDTYATVWLNGEQILSSENMFVGHRVDIRSRVRRVNTLELRFRSPLAAAHPLYEAAGSINYPADNDHAPIHYSVFTRKAPYHYGWDWGERMITIGPWRPVRLLLRGESYFAERPVITYHPERKLPIEVRLPEAAVVGREASQLSYRLYDAEGREVFARVAPLAEFTTPSERGGLHALSNLQLWWPQGMGAPYRYEARFALQDARGRTLDTLRFRVGFRTTELVREPDERGRSFYFRVNGKPLFAKGANYIPGTLMLPERSDAELSQLFDDMQRSHFNMVRVWGGGTYESDRFYDEADARGLLVWQDFMFACTAYPGDSAFLRNVESELIYNIRRLRQHPSIATWCGNNEIREGLKYWGWAKKYPAEVYQRFWRDYEALFQGLIPKTLQREDPLRSYIESSPDTVNWGRPAELGLGESHYWGVWYGREPFEILRERIPRFMSEFGVESFPMMSSIRQFALPEDYDLASPVMTAHQKSSIGNEVILHYIRQDYPEPKDFADFVYLSQVMQARGIALGIRAERAAAPYCMGSLYWQLNDAWPAVSWSSIDFYGAWKGLQYHAAKAFEPIVIVPDSVRGQIFIAHDNLPESKRVRLVAEVIDFSGQRLRAHQTQPFSLSTSVGADSVALRTVDLIGSGEAARHSLVRYRLHEVGTDRVLAEWLDYACRTKELQLPEAGTPDYTITRKADGRGYLLTIRPRTFYKDLYIDLGTPGLHLSDNFLDLLPGETYTFEVTARVGYQLPRVAPAVSFRYIH